jgi:hypothetical protein
LLSLRKRKRKRFAGGTTRPAARPRNERFFYPRAPLMAKP